MNPQTLKVENLIIIHEVSFMRLTSFFFSLLLLLNSILRANNLEIDDKAIEVQHPKNKSNQSVKDRPAKDVLTFEQWVANGKKLPEGMMFIGGTPWFNESTGKKRTAKEVYDRLYPQKNTGPLKPNRPRLKTGRKKPFPKHWGDPPKRQTRDLRPLPGGYGMGSGTLAKWIQENLDRDRKHNTLPD
jgi:hypothetical protein